MADPTGRADLERWRELARKERKGADPEGLVWQTPEGIEVKPLYTAADVAGLDFLDSVPGDFPFLRGPRATMYAETAVDHPPVRRLLHRRGVERLLPREPRRRADGAVGRLRSRHPPRLRLGPPARRRRRRQGRRRDRLGRGHEDPLRRRAARQDVGVDDDERRRAAGARELHRRRRGAGRAARAAHRDHPERHPQGVHGPQHLHLSADALDADRAPTSSSTRRRRCRASTRSRSPATTCRKPERRATSSSRSPSPTGSSTCAPRSRRASTSTPSPGGCRSSSPSA